MEYFNRAFVAVSIAVVLASLMPYADSLPYGEGLQNMQKQGYNWHHEQGIPVLPDPQKTGQEIWRRELGENGHRGGNWQNGEQGENWHQKQESPQLPYKETTAQRADLQNKRSERQRLQRWPIDNWPNEQQQFEMEKYRRQEEIVKQDETQRQGQQQKERKYEQQKQENFNWQQSQAIPLDPRQQYSRWQNIPQLHQAQGQPVIPDGGAHKYNYPNKQVRYHQQGEWPRPYTYQASALNPEIYHNTQEFPFLPRYPELETDKNAYAKSQQIIYDKVDDSKVQIPHVPIPNTPVSKLIPLPFPYNVANTHVGSQGINDQQKLMNSNIQPVKKRLNLMRSDADAIAENRYQQYLNQRREPQVRPQPKPKQSLIDEQITKARNKSDPSSEPEPVNDQSKLIAESITKYNYLNQIQKNREYRLINRELRQKDTNNEKVVEESGGLGSQPLLLYNEKLDHNEPEKEPKEAPSITFEPPKDILNGKQQIIIPQEQEDKTQQIPTTDSDNVPTLVVGQTSDQNEKSNQKAESNDRRNRRRRRQKPSQHEENSKQTEATIEKRTVEEYTTKINPPAEKLFGNDEQDETASKEVSQPEENPEQSNDDITDKDDHINYNDSKDNDDSENNDDKNTKKAPDDDSDNGDKDGPKNVDNDSKDNEDQKSKIPLDDDDDSIDRDEPNDGDDDYKDNEDLKTTKVFNDAGDDSTEKNASEITVTDTSKTEQNGQDDRDDVTTATLTPAQPIENVWYSIVDYYYGDDSITNKTINTDTNEDEIPTIDIANIIATEIINSLIPSNYANTFNFIRIIATNSMRGRDGIKNIIKEPVIKGYVSQITEKIIPIYLKVKSFVEPHAYRDCKVDDVVQEELDV